MWGSIPSGICAGREDGSVQSTIDLLARWVVAAGRASKDWCFAGPDIAAKIENEWFARPTLELFAGRAIAVDAAVDRLDASLRVRELFLPVAHDDPCISRVGAGPASQGPGIGWALVERVLARSRHPGHGRLGWMSVPTIRGLSIPTCPQRSPPRPPQCSDIASLLYCSMRIEL